MRFFVHDHFVERPVNTIPSRESAGTIWWLSSARRLQKLIEPGEDDEKSLAAAIEMNPQYEYNLSSNPRHEFTTLYVSRGGSFFIAGVGGVKSRWGRQISSNIWSGGAGLELVDATEAQRLAKQWGASAEDMHKYFRIADVSKNTYSPTHSASMS